MKTLSKKDLQEKADKVFQQFPTAKKVFATVDGNVFLQKNRAELHSKDTIYKFERQSSSNQAGKQKILSKAKDIIEFIQGATDLESILPYADDTRSTVIEAYTLKAGEMAKELEVNQ